jgi:uncharacterized protein with von Willebrand factor type A (vWA) domain
MSLEEKYNAQQEEAENKPQSPISETPIEETDFNKTFKQLEEGLNVLLLTDNNDNDDTQASNEDLDELKHELNEISKQLEEQEKDTGLLSRAEEYADKLRYDMHFIH